MESALIHALLYVYVSRAVHAVGERGGGAELVSHHGRQLGCSQNMYVIPVCEFEKCHIYHENFVCYREAGGGV